MLKGDCNSPHRRGFTIIEILVATAVTALLVTMMLNIATNVLSAWSRSSGSLTANSQARVVLDEVTRDLQSLVMLRDENADDPTKTTVWLAATVQGDQKTGTGESQMADASWTLAPGGVGKPLNSDERSLDLLATRSQLTIKGRLVDARFGHAGMWLRMITTPPDTNEKSSNDNDPLKNLSAPRAVSYQIVRRRLGTSSGRVYQLFRSEVRPGVVIQGNEKGNSTFHVGYNLLMPVSASNGGPSYNAPNSATSTVRAKDADNIRTPLSTDVIANNVIDFGVRFYDSKGEPFFKATTPKGVSVGFVATSQPSVAAAPYISPKNLVPGFPASAEILVRILTDEGARLIQNLESPPPGFTATESWWDIAEQHSVVFVRRIEIPSRAL